MTVESADFLSPAEMRRNREACLIDGKWVSGDGWIDVGQSGHRRRRPFYVPDSFSGQNVGEIIRTLD